MAVVDAGIGATAGFVSAGALTVEVLYSDCGPADSSVVYGPSGELLGVGGAMLVVEGVEKVTL
jgi:hypothetical protein